MKGSGLRKISKKKIGTGIIIVIVLAGAGIGFLLLRGGRAAAMQLTVTAQETAARKGSISNTVVGTGNLEEDAGDTQKVPAGLEYDEILVETGDEVQAGDSLAVINRASLLNMIVETQEKLDSLGDDIEDAAEEDSGSYEYKALAAEKEEGEAFLEELKALTETYTITAQQAGTVQSVSLTSKDDTTSKSNSDSSAGSSTGNSSTGNSGGVTGTAAGFAAKTAGGFLYLNSTENVQAEEAAELSEGSLDGSAGVLTPDADEDSGNDSAQEAELISDCRDLSLQIPRTGDPMEKSIDMTRYAGTVNWSETEEHYTADVCLTANNGYAFAADIQPVINGGTVSECSVSGEGEGNQLTFRLTVDKQSHSEPESGQSNGNKTDTGNESESTSGAGTEGNAGGNSDTGSAGGTADANLDGNISGQVSDSGSAGSVTAGSVSADSGVTGSTASGSESESGSGAGSIDANHTQAFSIASGDKMLLSVNVDELDILSVAVGQDAEITFDALEGQSYTGKITEISDSASVSGGVARYAVKIELAKDENMRAGMNASATITIESKEDIITIPLNALQEQGGRTFVYTQKNEETGQLSGETEVETGLSDGENVEITSGLSEGDTVYYHKTGSSESEDSIMVPDGGVMMFEGGAMPDGGGGRPSGDSGGGPGGGAPGM
ncbi:HlyD family efflux transporter periplasmic adaptor subunit [Ruminococcus gauvreauii]|uniref:HlyD family efflux transporter periplasmic adaptor subunit n=1 Tax=Ruminococcus gauvreauii TaxID=438033 RepID=A0ABY5VJA5_9FIRM|nr:HlyD family efflux transporter periplasmic adaptor subunit [Ruminococcus gauvreauii]UWP60670.1 HlyD family efflux transporter periplasmic adaptor subunit [Ruminococcus gauvreauii]